MLSEDIRHGGKVNRNIRCSVIRSSILWRYNAVVGSVLNETATEPVKCHPNLHSYFQFSRLFSQLLRFTSLRAKMAVTR